MDRHLFERLIDEAIGEIAGHCAEYFSLCSIDVDSPSSLAEAFRRSSAFSSYSEHELAGSIDKGIAVLQQRGITVRRGVADRDKVSELMTSSIMDAFLAASGQIPLRPAIADVQSAAERIGTSSITRTTKSGVGYVLTGGPGKILLVISATGVPVCVWDNLLCDRALARRYLFVQSQCGSLLEGGTANQSSLWEDVDRILDVLDVEKPGALDVLAWCDGGRAGIELARRLPTQVASLSLLAPTFHGAVDPAAYPSPFEDNLRDICDLLGKTPERDRFLLTSVATSAGGNAAGLARDIRKLRNVLLRLPPHRFVRELILPLSSVPYFRNYVARLALDESYDVRAALAELECPVLWIAGTEDAVVNTNAANDVLTQAVRHLVRMRISGAGHHVHVLQYMYLRYALKCFLSGENPRDTARVTASSSAIDRSIKHGTSASFAGGTRI